MAYTVPGCSKPLDDMTLEEITAAIPDDRRGVVRMALLLVLRAAHEPSVRIKDASHVAMVAENTAAALEGAVAEADEVGGIGAGMVSAMISGAGSLLHAAASVSVMAGMTGGLGLPAPTVSTVGCA